MRLIDADLLKGRFIHGRFDDVYISEKEIQDAPTVNAIPLDDFFPTESVLNNVNKVEIKGKKFVSVVRCGECRHKCGEHDGYICCDKNVWHEPDWFCADGERKGQNDE